MKFIVFLIVVLVAVVSAQFGDFYGGGFYGPGNTQAFAAPMAAARDPRQNTGPVVFPPSPPGNPADTSGVVVGASGYGFVPPSDQGFSRYRFHQNHNGFFFK